MEFNHGNQYVEQGDNTDRPIIETRYIKELDMYYVLHNAGKSTHKLYDTPDKMEALEMQETLSALYHTAYLDGLGYALFDIEEAAKLHEKLTG